MKRLFTLLLALLLSSTMMAKDFVRISYANRAELEKAFNDPNLTVHYYTNSEVFATTERFDANMMVLIDHQAFEGNDVYTLVYCPQAEQQAYLQDKDALLQTDNYVVVRGAALPYKNDGAVAIFNKAAQLPRLTRDFPVVTEENPAIREMLWKKPALPYIVFPLLALVILCFGAYGVGYDSSQFIYNQF